MQLAAFPSPLEPAPRFSAAIGAEVWIKRDDAIGGPGFAGNKVRKLQRLLPGALDRGADTVVMVGAAQSNAARATAAACARLGLRCVLVLVGEPPEGPPEANLLLDALFGAELRWAGPAGWEALEAEAARVEAELGSRAFRMPLGCSTPEGTLGMTDAWRELLEQLPGDAAAVWHASSSGGTHAGFALGRALHGGPRVRAVGVAGDLGAYTGELAAQAAACAGVPDAPLDPQDLALDMSQLGEGYGLPTRACVDAIRLLARTEGIVCDPVYSGKALAALVAADQDGPAVFWHTGGWQACFGTGFAVALAGGEE